MTTRVITSCVAVFLLTAVAMAVEITEPVPVPGSPGYGEEMPYMSGSYLGVDTQEVTSERKAALKLPEERGVEITLVDSDAPAGKAGLKEHDVIWEFNGVKVESVEQLRRLIRETPPGRAAGMVIMRDGQAKNIQVQLAERKDWAKIKPPRIRIAPLPRVPAMPAMPALPAFEVVRGYSRGGITVENLTPQLGEYFGVKNAEGVLVRAVEKGSPAEAAGLKAGDVIVRVENERIADKSDWRAVLRSRRAGKVTLGIIRDKREQTLSMTLPEAKDSGRIEIEIPDVEVDLEEIEGAVYRLEPHIQRATRQALVLSQQQVRKAMREAEAGMQQHLQCLEKELKDAEKELDKTVEREQ
jgi:C-terminal processing protease CtpA/Prc